MFSRIMTGILIKRHNPNLSCETVKNFQYSTKIQGRYKWCKCKISMWLKGQSIQIVRACTKQFEYVAAMRVRRSIQIFHLYTRIWDEIALKEFIRSWRRRVTNNTREFLIGAVGVTAFNWEQERIVDDEMYSYSQEIERIHKLKNLTIVCSNCNLRLVIDYVLPGVEYCKCPSVKCTSSNLQPEDWKPYIERQDMLVWRREEKDCNGLYSYKVYGSFDDVSAEDFLNVQLDIDYRKKWDDTAKQLEIIDTDPSSAESSNSCSDIIYWEMVWPSIFSNRDYVYKRRWLYDEESGIVIIVSKGTDHPNAPKRNDTYRVTRYWSYMVIKPYTDFDKPGIEFGLTYFDDPGVNIPSAVTSWVSATGLPNYLCKMREAGKEYKNYKRIQEPEVETPETDVIHSQDNEDSNSASDVNFKQDSTTADANYKQDSTNSDVNYKQDSAPSEQDKIIPDNITNQYSKIALMAKIAI